MEMVRRNTDYALRAMVYLAGHCGNSLVSARELSQKGDIPYQLACKLLQMLHKARLVKSCMGPKGGFRLSRALSEINLLEIIMAIQGKVRLNRCLLAKNICPHQKGCRVRMKLAELESSINTYLGSITLDEIVRFKGSRSKTRRDKGRQK